MIVMMIAKTPSLNASSLFLPIFDPASLEEPPARHHRRCGRHRKQQYQDGELLSNPDVRNNTVRM
jgi:hypothetical protein